MWRHHVIYESRPRSVIVTMGGQPYMIPDVVHTTIQTKHCHKVIYHIKKFSLFKTYS
jgi:hypothetical protein